VVSLVPVQTTSVHRTWDKSGGSQGERDLKVWSRLGVYLSGRALAEHIKALGLLSSTTGQKRSANLERW
jgi:hypothetical protein